MHPFWNNYSLPSIRSESHFGDRVVSCFTPRWDSVYGMFHDTVMRFADHDALYFEGRTWTYRELSQWVELGARALKAAGLKRGDRLVLWVSNRPEFVVAFYAAQFLGAICVPISIREQGPGVAFMLAQCGASMLLHDEALSDRLPDASEVPTCVSLSIEHWLKTMATGDAQSVRDGSAESVGAAPLEGNVRGVERQAQEIQTQEIQTQEMQGWRHSLAQDVAVILYTSGTTGRPKGAMLTHFNIAHSVLHFIHCSRWTDQSRSIMAVPASHVTGLIANIATAVGAGACTVIMASFKASEYLRLAEEQGLTHTILVPAMYNLCLLEPDFDRYDLSRWQRGGYGGAPMPAATIDALARKLPTLKLQNCYGATETASPTTMMPPEYQRDHLDSVGVALPCAVVKIMDDEGCEVAPGETGEIWIGGPMVVKGYWNNPQATASEFTAGFWHSGDLGSIDEQGFVRLYDRKKDMLNRGGFKIYSVEVENLMMGFPGVLEAAIVGKPCPVLGERVHAFVYGGEAALGSQPLDVDALKAWCARHLSDYKVPETITLETEPLPRNANGKLMKRLMREKLA